MSGGGSFTQKSLDPSHAKLRLKKVNLDFVSKILAEIENNKIHCIHFDIAFIHQKIVDITL
jgi:hypothetical protein